MHDVIEDFGYYCSRWPMEQKAWIDVKSPHFFIWKAIQYIEVFVSGVKPLVLSNDQADINFKNTNDVRFLSESAKPLSIKNH